MVVGSIPTGGTPPRKEPAMDQNTKNNMAYNVGGTIIWVTGIVCYTVFKIKKLEMGVGK